MSDLDEVIRNAVALRMLSFLQGLLDLGPRDRGVQRAARERVKFTVLLHCIRICSFAGYSSHPYEHLKVPKCEIFHLFDFNYF